jgi:hypothetical protein
MNWIDYIAKEVSREIGRRSREFYELVMPPVDMYEDEAGLYEQRPNRISKRILLPTSYHTKNKE